MASIRDRITAAAIIALNTGTPGGIPAAERVRLADVGLEDLPSIIVFPVGDEVEPVGPPGSPAVRARLRLAVECRAAGTPTVRPDQALDALYVWVVKVLAQKKLSDGGGLLSHEASELQTTFAFEQGEVPYGLATVEFSVSYQHVSTDPEARV